MIDIEKIRNAIISGTTGVSEYSDSWISPRRFLDGDLPKVMSGVRGGRCLIGYDHIISDPEVCVLLEAFRGRQYQGYLRHLMHSFCEDQNSVFPAKSLEKTGTCSICGKQIMYWSEWRSICKENPGLKEEESKNFLAFGSSHTKTVLCIDCLIQLKALKDFLDSLDPGILDYRIHTQWGLKS